MSWLCPGQELEWHQDLLSMVGVPCEYHIPKSLQQRQLGAFSQCSLTAQLAAPCRYPSSSQGCFPLGFKSLVSLQGASGSQSWIWPC